MITLYTRVVYTTMSISHGIMSEFLENVLEGSKYTHLPGPRLLRLQTAGKLTDWCREIKGVMSITCFITAQLQ